MAAYVIAELDITDPTVFDAYRKLVPASIARHGGRYLARGGKAEAFEGAAPKRIVVLEFPSYAQAQTWYNSPDYQEILKLRLASSIGRVMLVEGAPQ